jgi:hypothetical protein
MANTIGFGQASVNNTNGFGKAPTNNTIDFGEVCADSWSTETNLTGAGATPSFSNTKSISLVPGIDDYVDGSTTYSELNGTTKATWSLWVKPILDSTDVLSRVSSSTSTSAFVYQLVLIASGEVLMQIGDTTRRARTGSNVLTNNVWSHILVCYDGTLSNGSKTKIFINGVDSTSSDSTTATSLITANYPLSIGRRDQTPTYYYDGFMDELAMWSSTDLRSSASNIYNSGTPNNLNDNGLTAPTSWWRCGDGDSSPNITDNGTSNYDLTMQNFSTFSTDVPT